MTTPGFANGGYMTAPGFANGGYMTAPGFARGGAVRRRPKDSEPINPSDDSSLKTFTNKHGKSYTVPNVNIRSGEATGTTMHMEDWASIARAESGANWQDALGTITKTSRGVFVGPLMISRRTWETYSGAYRKQTGVDVGNFNNPNNIPSWEDQVKIAEMVAFKGIPDSPYEYYRKPKFLDGFESVRKNRVYFKPLSELKTFDKALGFANGGAVRRPKTGGSAGSIYNFDYRGVIPDRIEDKLRAKGIPSSRRQIPKEQDPNSRRRGRITPIIPPEKRYPQDGSYEVEAPWAGYTNQPDPPWIHHEGGGADRQPQMITWKDHVGEPVGSFGFPVRYRHILGYYPTDRIPLGGKKGEDVSIVWDGKNRWTRSDSGVKKYLGGMIPQFKLGGFLKPGFGLPRLRSFGLPKLKNFNPLSWLFGKKGKNQTTFQKKPENVNDYSGNSYYSQLADPQFIGNMPPQLAYVNDAANTQREIARGMVNFSKNNALIIRGLKKIYVNPLYWNDESLFRNDGDAAYRIAANYSTDFLVDKKKFGRGDRNTDHSEILAMHQGISDAMATMSTYLGVPFEFAGPKGIPNLSKGNQMLLNLEANYSPRGGWAGRTFGDITSRAAKTPSRITIPRTALNTKRMIESSIDFNVGGGNMSYKDPLLHKQVFMHEFGHIGGFDHPHEYLEAVKEKYGPNNSEEMLNSIMSYDSNYAGEGHLLPADINAWRSNMGYGLAAPTIVKRLDRQWSLYGQPIAGGAKVGRGWLQSPSKLNKTKNQLPKVKKFAFGGFLKPGFGLPRLKGFNPLSWLFGKKDKSNNQNQTMFTDKPDKPKFSIKKEPWKTYLKNQLKFFPDKTEQQITEELYAEYLANLEDNGPQEVILPVPQYIKNMPLQLAMENDSVNKIGQIARGGVVQTGLTENGLIMRGIKKIFVSPEYWNEKELFRNDGDSIWRKAANKTTKDNVLTSHMSMLELHKGVTAAMDSMSKYLNIPYQFTYSPKQFGVIPTIKDLKKSMVLDVFGDFDPSSGFAGYTYSNIKTPSSPRSNASVKEAIRQASNYSSIFLNTTLANEVDNGMPYYGTEEWSQVFMHEFGHVAGAFDHPHEYNQALSRKFDGSSNTNKMLNSIMSYDTNGGKITRQLRPTDINAYKEVMGFSLSPASIIRRLDANKNIFNSQGSVPNERRRGSGYMLDLINKKKQLPKVKKFEQGGFIGPMLPKKKKSFWGKVGGIGKGAFNIGKEILRPKNSFAIAGGTLAAILATPGGPAAMVAAGMAGSAAGGGIGSFVEQAFDKKKGFQPLDIGKNMLLQGAMYGLGAGAGAIGERFIMPALAKYGTPALRGMSDVAMNKLGLAGMDVTAIPGLIKAGVSYTKSKALSLLGKGVGKASPYVDDVLKDALEKQGYLLHHSRNSIKIGDFVRQRLIGSDQVTAGDALPGYSYAWDALTGVDSAVKNQVSGRISRFLPNGLLNFSVPEQFQDFFVHLTRAQKSNIYPDLNVPGSPARAITSAQEVIDSIKIPAIISNDEAEMFVRNMLIKNNVPFNLNSELSREINKRFLFSKGSRALEGFHKGQFEEYATRVFRQFDKGAPAWANGVLGKDAKLAHDLYLSGDIEKAKELLYSTFLGTAAGQKVSGLKNLLTIKQLTTGIPRFEKGGYLKFKEGGEVPSILHGGEYVLNAAAVKKYGLAHIEAMNQMKFNVPSAGFSVPQASYSGNMAGGMTTSTQNVNIYVDNFIGEPEWFNSMMKDYNTKILPKNQKAAGLENRVISTYNGLNRGQ
jgi:hypothetical protein